VLLHVASTPAGAAVTVSIIFLLIFAMSFAFGPVPEGGRRFSGEWTREWLRASIPRLIVAGVFAGLVLAAALSYGNGSTQAAVNCDKSVPPLTGSAVDDPRMLLAINSLDQMVDAADNNDEGRAQTVWLTSDAHNLSHDIDGPLRKAAPDLARSLCEEVVALENVMVGQIVTAQVASNARLVAEALQEARPILRGNADAATPAIQGPCEKPIGAVTSDPLTAQRLQSAIEQLRQVSSLAESGDKAGMTTLFAGDAHDLTHDIDGPLRNNNEQIAIDLCRAVAEIERNLGVNYDAGIVVSKASEAADYLEQGGRALGILQ
jgi:hypothetical protein